MNIAKYYTIIIISKVVSEKQPFLCAKFFKLNHSLGLNISIYDGHISEYLLNSL